METELVKVSTKGQITLPKRFRESLGLKPGDEALIVATPDGLLVKPKFVPNHALRGILRDEIDIDRVESFIDEERKKWRL
ncbi:MAG: AbrB/MazE/SpoVT family DNA-binding domain-containing protein [Promethearchaeota archaeon]